MAQRSRSRCYMITIFNKTEEEIKTMLNIDNITYATGQEEICPTTNKKHFQGYIELKNPVGIKSIKQALRDDTIHLETRKGSQKQALEYVLKEETRNKNGYKIEIGTKKEQGKRTDLERALELVKQNTKVNDIIDELPGMWRYDRNIERYKQRAIPERKWQTELIVIIGKPGTGKTRYVWDNETDIYTLPEGSSGTQWFDGYEGQEIVLIDDFSGNIRYNFLLQLTDRYPMKVNIKGGMVNWAPKKIYITSNFEVDQWYLQDNEALKRRITKEINMGTQEVAQK